MAELVNATVGCQQKHLPLTSLTDVTDVTNVISSVADAIIILIHYFICPLIHHCLIFRRPLNLIEMILVLNSEWSNLQIWGH